MLNLIPEGYVLAEDAAGFIVIRPKVEPPTVVTRQRNEQEIEEEINVNDVSF